MNLQENHTLTIPLMKPFASWPHWREPTVELDPVVALWRAPWAGWLKEDEAVTFMGLQFMSRYSTLSHLASKAFFTKAIAGAAQKQKEGLESVGRCHLPAMLPLPAATQ